MINLYSYDRGPDIGTEACWQHKSQHKTTESFKKEPVTNFSKVDTDLIEETLTDKSFKIEQMNNPEMGDVYLPKVSWGEDAIIPESFDSSKDGTCLIDVDSMENDPNRHFSIVTESCTNRANLNRTRRALKTNVDLDAPYEIINDRLN